LNQLGRRSDRLSKPAEQPRLSKRGVLGAKRGKKATLADLRPSLGSGTHAEPTLRRHKDRFSFRSQGPTNAHSPRSTLTAATCHSHPACIPECLGVQLPNSPALPSPGESEQCPLVFDTIQVPAPETPPRPVDRCRFQTFSVPPVDQV
jgi:hypothetical protein